MKILQLFEENKEKSILLSQVKDGDVIRFARTSFEEALKEDLFYYVLSTKNGRSTLVCLANAEQIVRDTEWEVIVHDTQIHIVK